MSTKPRRFSLGLIFGLLAAGALHAHLDTLPAAPADQALADGSRHAGAGAPAANSATLRVRLEDAASHQPLDGLIRVTPADGSGPARALAGLFERPAGWFAMGTTAELALPPGSYRVEATRGTDYQVTVETVDCAASGQGEVRLALTRFYQPEAAQLHSANTHLHLLLHSGAKVGVDLQDRADTDAYLRTVGGSDGLDLLYVSYLTSPGGQIISNDYTDADLKKLSEGPTLFVNGVEHRHGGIRVQVAPAGGAPAVERNKLYPVDSTIVSMTYGHVLLLDLAQRSMVASVGPGLSDSHRATDGTSLRGGINAARAQGGGVIWCHGTMGLEGLPDWFAGLIHAQNIYDGGNEGDFDSVYYPYLNAGLKVPFSTGTDWGITDFSRVYVAAPGAFSSKAFLKELTAGRSYITNEPFLEFKAGAAAAGDTITLDRPGTVPVHGRAVGRSDFLRLQLVCNGRVVHEVPCRAVGGHFEAELDYALPVGASGWFALRIPPAQPYEYRSKYSGPGTNILGKAIFAHTSPVYVTVGGRPVCERAAVEALIARTDAALKQIADLGTFADDAERDGIRNIYLETKTSLQAMLAHTTPSAL